MISKKGLPLSVLASLGVVYGDIGTSPLYAMRATLEGLIINQANVLGVLSLIFWTLILIISIKYLIIIFRADNEGEGGVFALMALLKQKKTRFQPLFYLIAIFGAGLLVGDGMLTPAISVTSALEGLEVMTPDSHTTITVISILILAVLFWMQSKGTDKIGYAFGPLILIWFITIALLGLSKIIAHPRVLCAVDPFYALDFFRINGLKAYFLLGGVFLVVTGGEALYADIGHFGKQPIRYSWFLIALPCLLINYFGQGANLLMHPEHITNPFYMLSPSWFCFPLLIIAAIATIIASQAVISATFSMLKQAVLLGFYPRLPIIQTSQKQSGQIYIPQVNFFLFIGTISLILLFQSSSHLTHAYGIAVNGLMLMVTVMVSCAAVQVWHWSIWRTMLVFTPFLLIDLLFFGANLDKFHTGGWLPVCFALVISFIMHTWNLGLQYLKKNFYLQKNDIVNIVRQFSGESFHQLDGLSAICITDIYDNKGGSFLHFLNLSKAIPEHILIVNYVIENIPHVSIRSRFELNVVDKKLHQLTLHYGFMDDIAIPEALRVINDRKLLPFQLNVDTATFLVEIPNIMASKAKRTLRFYWQEKLFAFLMRNYAMNMNIEFYKLPYERTIAIGSYCQI